jgi:hypothetical protein
MKYLSALLIYIERRMEGGRGGILSIKTRAVCGTDRRCVRAVHRLMMRLVEKGLARLHKRGVYLIERRAAEEVLTALKRQFEDGGPAGLRQHRRPQRAGGR